MAEFPIMPMFWDAYFGDTKHLSCLEHGAYCQILGRMWLEGGTLPDDDRFLTRMTGLRQSQWKRMRPTIMAFMHPVSGGRFTQDKLLQTFDVVRIKSKKAAHSANTRWLKKKGLSDALAVRPHSDRNAIKSEIRESSFLGLSPSPREEKKEAAEGEQAKPPETIVVTSVLEASRLVRKAS